MKKLENKNGFQTKVWGPSAWLFLHCVAQNYDPNKVGMKKGYHEFFKNIEHVLPCGKCRENYSKIVSSCDKRYKFDYSKLASRKALSYWLFLVHNKVQSDIHAKTKKQSDEPMYKNTLKDFYKSYKFYENFRANCNLVSYGCNEPLKGTKKKAVVKISNCDPKSFKAHKSIVVSKKCGV